MSEKKTLSPLTPAEKERILQAAGSDSVLLSLIGGCALTVEEAAALRWADVNPDTGMLSVSNRKVPISPEAARLLAEEPRQSAYVIPSLRNKEIPMHRVAISRKVRQALDKAGFPELDASALRNLRILELMETLPIEEVSRATGYEVRSLRTLWSRYRETPLPVRPRKRSTSLDESALLAALEREGDTLAARAVWLSWQGGLTVAAMRSLAWEGVSPYLKKWTVEDKVCNVPEALRPRLRSWRKNDGGQGLLLRGSASDKSPEPAFLVRRVSGFFLREGLDDLTLAALRGRAGEESRLETVLETSPQVTAQSLCRELGISRKRAESVVAVLEQNGSLPPDSRARFTEVLTAHRGDTVTTALLRQETGFAPGLLHYYIKEALEKGRLQKEKHGIYRCL